MLPFFADLITRTDEARREFETNPVVLDAVANGMSIERYRKLLHELYHVVWHFNPVCAAAASRVPDTERQVRYFLYEHMHEESGHEEWVMNDLEAVGVSPAATRTQQPSVHTLALTGFNYWAADRRHPCSVLGMMYALEVIASVISSHATMDAEHMIELRKVLNTITDEAAREAVVESTLVNFHHFTRMFEAV
jgi:Iron-containing redox enzyme